MAFSVGDIIRCIDRGEGANKLTNGKLYTVLANPDRDASWVTVIDDSGVKDSFFTYRFVLYQPFMDASEYEEIMAAQAILEGQ